MKTLKEKIIDILSKELPYLRERYGEGLSFDAFIQDRKTQDAIVRNLDAL